MGHYKSVDSVTVPILRSLLLVRTVQAVKLCPHHLLETTGQFIDARFSSINSSAIRSCTLDGQPMTIQVWSSILQCTNNGSIQHGSHILTDIAANVLDSSPLLFDYIVYDPNEKLTDADIVYSGEDSGSNSGGQLVFLGDTLDFTFIGK